MRIIMAIRLRSRILDILLHPLSMTYIILICINTQFFRPDWEKGYTGKAEDATLAVEIT